MAAQWFYRAEERTIGPVASSQLLDLARTGQISKQTLVRRADQQAWVQAEQLKGLFLPDDPLPSHNGPPPLPDQVAEWYVRDVSGNILGPITKKQLDSWVSSGHVNADFHLRQGNVKTWQNAGSVFPALNPGKLLVQRVAKDTQSGIKELRGHSQKYLSAVNIDVQIAPAHLRRCILNAHHQFTTHDKCVTCGTSTVGLNVASVINGEDLNRQKAIDLWTQGRKTVRKVYTWCGIVAVCLSAITISVTWWSIVLVPLFAGIAMMLPAISAKIVRSRINKQIEVQSNSAPRLIDEDAIEQVNESIVAPFFRRNEQDTGNSSAGAFVVKRFQSFGQPTNSIIHTHEVQLLQQLLASKGFDFWQSDDELRAVLTAFSLKSDYDLFKVRLDRLAIQDSPALTAYASLVTNDQIYLPFLQQYLSERGDPNEELWLTRSLEEVRHRFKFQGFARDLELRRNNNLSVTMKMVDEMNPYSFELLLGMIFECQGFHVIETPKSGDQGADVLIEKAGEKIVVQAKLYTDTVGNKAVQEAFSAKEFFRCHKAMVVTNNHFTQSARQLAERNNVILVGRDQFERLLEDFNHSPKDYCRLETLMKIPSITNPPPA